MGMFDAFSSTSTATDSRIGAGDYAKIIRGGGTIQEAGAFYSGKVSAAKGSSVTLSRSEDVKVISPTITYATGGSTASSSPTNTLTPSSEVFGLDWKTWAIVGGIAVFVFIMMRK